MILCGSGLRPPDLIGNTPLLRLASDAGCAGILLGEGCTLANASPLVEEAARASLSVGAILAPLPEVRPPAGRRLPRLGAPDRSEREAAVTLALQAFALAGSLGTPMVALGFGPLALAAKTAELGRFFRRRELAEGEAGEAPWLEVMEERREKIGAVLDACRRSMDLLVREGEQRGVRVALELAATPFGVPSPREGLELLAGYAGARMGVVLDAARLSVMRRLGLGISAERLAALRAAALLLADNQAVGVEAGYLPGLGEPDDDDLAATAAPQGLPAETPLVLIGGSDATDAEVIAAAAARKT
jgi:sugar phosphate isomerase/epimerase